MIEASVTVYENFIQEETMKPIALYFSLLTVLALLVACVSQELTPSSKGRSVTDYDSLFESLQDEGATVELTGNVTQPFFTPQG